MPCFNFNLGMSNAQRVMGCVPNKVIKVLKFDFCAQNTFIIEICCWMLDYDDEYLQYSETSHAPRKSLIRTFSKLL